MKPLNWAIIGLGRFGKIHARVIQGLPDINLVAACGRDPQRLQQHAQQVGIEDITTDYRQLLERDDVDVVVSPQTINSRYIWNRKCKIL